ncbi:hypothetical protein CAPTEDRAFT_220792 [Capitella teleta]|uniref:Uncharacterized protein n=1 Tax=Capitella teleta TaxID=283909 RepID=R7TIA2_CAPTE|nr:hypothetical protein CAPTEDRAFT_220792 [Capitella teleta]|eukprot:ELT93459.1 hypothetical protein CAPTEDRAFT_220792 [Capitella teleta]
MSEVFVLQGSQLDNPSMNADLNRVMKTETKNKHSSVKSSRSVKSVGGLSIFKDPETSATLPRDEEVTYSVYDAHTEEPKHRISSSTPVKDNKIYDKKTKKLIKVNSKSNKKGRYIISADSDLPISGELPLKIDDKKSNKSNVALTSTKGNVPNQRKDKKKLPLTGMVNRMVSQSSREEELEHDTGERTRPEMVVKVDKEQTDVSDTKFALKDKKDNAVSESKQEVRKMVTNEKPEKTQAGERNQAPQAQQEKGKIVSSEKGEIKKTSETKKEVINPTEKAYSKDDIKLSLPKTEQKVSLKTNSGFDESFKETEAQSQNSTIKRQNSSGRTGVEKQGSFTFKSTHSIDTGRSRKDAAEFDDMKNLLEDSLSRRMLKAKKESERAARELNEEGMCTSSSTVHTLSLKSLAEQGDDGLPEGTPGVISGNSHLNNNTRQNISTTQYSVTVDTHISNAEKEQTQTEKQDTAKKRDEVKAKISMLVAQRPVETAASAPSSMQRRTTKKAFEMKTVEIGSIDAKPMATSSLPRNPSAPATISSTPTSPIEEMRDTIKSGKVGLLIEDKFKNLNLTGRSMDATTLERQKRKANETDPTKKYKFVVEGIDVPAPPEPETPNTPLSSLSPMSPSSPIPLAPPLPGQSSETPSGPSTLQRLKKEGFSYLLDEKLTGEIMKRAADVTAKKPHETVEHGREKEQEAKSEDAVLVQARAKLVKQDSLEPIRSPKPPEIIEGTKKNLQYSSSRVTAESVMNEQDDEDHNVPEVTRKNDEKNLGTVVASPQVNGHASVNSVPNEVHRKEKTSLVNDSVNTQDAVADVDMEVEVHRSNGHALVNQSGQDMLTAEYALNEVRRNPRTEYEAKKTVVKEVKTTKKIIGSRGPVDGPTETQTHQKAAITSVVQASSRGEEKKPKVTSEVRTSTETTQKEDGKVLSQQKSSETRKNQSGKPLKVTQRAVTDSEEDDVTEAKRKLQSRDDSIPVIEAELQPREHIIVASSFDRRQSNDDVFAAELSPLYIDPGDASLPQNYSPASYSSRGMTSGASTPARGHRGGSISLRPLRVDAGSSQSRHTRVSTHPAPPSPRQFVQQPISSHSYAARPHLARSHSSSAYDRRKHSSTMPSGRIHGPYIEPSMTHQGTGRRFLRVDETRSGMIPRYRTQDISVRDTAPRARSTLNLSRLDHPDYVDLSISDPDLSRNPGGRSVAQRVVERKVNHMDLHPDALRRQRGYHVGQHASLGSSRSDLGGVRVPIAVDTKLQEISRTGKDYHVTTTLKLNNATGPSPRGTLKSRTLDDRSEMAMARRRAFTEDGYGTIDRATVVRTGSQTTSLSPRVAHLQFQQHFAGEVDAVDSYRDPIGANTFVTKVGHDANNNPVNADSSFFIKSVNRSDNDQVHLIADVTSDDTDVDALHAHRSTAAWTPANRQAQPFNSTQPKQNGSEPRFSMMINQTMTMDYAPTDGSQPSPVDENIDPNRAGQNRAAPPQNNSREHRRTTEHIVITDDRRRRKKSPKPIDEDLLSPARNRGNQSPYRPGDSEEDSDVPIDENFMPQRSAPVNRPNKPKKRQPVDEDLISPARNRRNQSPYRPGDSEEDSDVPIDENFMPQRSAPVNRPNKPKKRQPVDEDMLSPSTHRGNEAPYKYGDDMDDDDDYYLDDDDDVHSDESDIPKIVRGSILIKNSIDTTSGPKVVDIVEGDSDDDDYNVEDNTNMFHGQYFQARENPLYSSQEDLRDLIDGDSPRKIKKTKQKPKFTKVFQKKEATNTNARIPNGYDNDEYETDIKVTRVQRGFGCNQVNAHFCVTGSIDPSRILGNRLPQILVHPFCDYGRDRRKGKKTEHMVNGHDQSSSTTTKMSMSQFDVNTLLAGAPPDSIKQTINVEREEEEIMGPLPDGQKAGPDGLLNFDTVSEKVDLGLVDGKAQVAVKVRCERIVPIRGVDDLFKKSSVIVTRLIEIDLQATAERRRLYQHIMKGSKEFDNRKLNTKDTFKLYKTFMGLAEADEAGGVVPQMTAIDREVEDECRPDLAAAQKHIDDVDIGAGEFDYVQRAREFDTDELGRNLEDKMLNSRLQRSPEPDTISYLSAASEVQDILY